MPILIFFFSAATEKKETPPPPPPKPTFSFGDIMADLNKQRDSISSKPAEDRPPETEEERKKRLRKEERRKLRVKWKPDDCLTEVRLFKRDPEEVPGDGAIRGAGDIREEGRMLKLHKDVEDLEDEEEVGLREEGLRTYQLPSGMILRPCKFLFPLPTNLRRNRFQCNRSRGPHEELHQAWWLSGTYKPREAGAGAARSNHADGLPYISRGYTTFAQGAAAS